MRALTNHSSQSNGSGAFRALRASVFWAFVISGFLNLLYFAPSLFMMQVYDRVLPTGGLATLAALSIAAVSAVVMIGLLDWVRGRLMLSGSRAFDARLTSLAASVQLDASWRQGMSNQMPPVRALELARSTIAAQHLNPVMDALWTPLFIFAAALIHPLIALIVIAGALFALIPAILQKRPSADQTAVLLNIQEHEWSHPGVIRSLGMNEAMVARYERGKFAPRLDGSLSEGGGNLLASLSRSLRVGLQMAVLATGAILAIEKQISPGALIAASIMSSRALGPIEQLAHSWRPAMAGVQAMRILGSAVRHAAARETLTRLPQPTGRLDFEAVAIAANAGDRPLFHQASFSVAPGEVVGIVGGSGTGKSSLARAAAGVLPIPEGVIRVDGLDIRSWDENWLGRHVGYLPQDIGLFSGTIAANISRFEELEGDACTALVVAAAKAAGVHDMIARMPRGYDTMLGVNGRGLSHGQAQRIALARALYREPPLLILDEPNAHLDDEGEAALVSALEATRARGAVCIVIAHRMGIMRVASRLLAIRDGRVLEVPKESLLGRRIIVGGNKSGAVV